jgi:hypothetical protein
MTRRTLLSFAFTIPCLPQRATGATAEPFVVIVHPSNRFDALSRSRINYLFLRRVSRWPWGAEVVPVELPASDKVRAEFVAQILRTTEEQLQTYWIDGRTTRGVSPPIQVPDVASVKALVAARPGAIGYIPPGALDGTVKLLRVDR